MIGQHIPFPSSFPAPAPEQIHLRLLATTDLHAHILPYDYTADAAAPDIGLAQAAARAQALREAAPNTLFFDNGDFLQGTPLADLAARALGEDAQAPHPIIAAMNAARIDAATLGNHEFNYGIEILRRVLAQASFPVVSANLRPTRANSLALCPPFVLLERECLDGAGRAHRLRIGVIGFVPPQSLAGDRQLRAAGLGSREILSTAREVIPQMRRAGADLIVALAHSGLGDAPCTGGHDHAAGALAASGLVDVVIAGHSHLTFPPPGEHHGGQTGAAVVMPGFWGRWLGRVDLMLDPEPPGWRICHHSATLCPSGGENAPPADIAVSQAAATAHDETVVQLRRPVGVTPTALTSHFELLQPSAAQRLIAATKRRHLQNWLTHHRLTDLPVLVAVPSFKCGGNNGPNWFVDIPAGPVLNQHLADLYPYPNQFRALRLTGADLLDWLEISASVYRHILPGGQDQPLIDPHFPSHKFDLIDGLSYRIDLSRPARFAPSGHLRDPANRRVSDIRFQGDPLSPNAEFLLATSNFRTDETGARRESTQRVILEDTALNRDLLLEHLRSGADLAADPAPDWRFDPMPGTTVLFDTGPGAAAHLTTIAAFAPEILGATETGFLRLRLHL
ncbi:2',3'-cyclic-nucleotide 2'-phosphodiesterase [Thioclava sp. BHET1]|nr:2',3'-cyclic-nucleotide 2'-phosphodiesterase [Thioclava sp. BHET1]